MESQKVTNEVAGTPQQLHGRWYDDACGTAFGLELLGERWAMLVVRELMLGGRRFSDIRTSLPGLSAKVLTERLTSLEQAGVVIRRRLAPPAAAQIYELSEWGYLAEPVMQELGRWAARSPAHNPLLPLSPVSFMLSLRTMFERETARGLELTAGITLGEESFLVELRGGELSVCRAEAGVGEIGLAAPVALPLLQVVYGTDDPEDAASRGDIAIRGDPALIRRFAALFALPEKIAVPPASPS